MVSPMREKRTWPPQDKDSDGETVAAFEAAVAVVKETVVRSGEVLVSAKEDLHDHQRWLKAQTAKVQADRTRHDRFLHRQRERQETLLRREQKRERRRAKRQAAARSIKDAVSAAIYAVRSAVSSAIYAVRSAVSSAIYAVRSAVWLVVAKTIAGLNSIDAAAAYGLRWLWGWARYGALYVAVHIQRGASFAGGAARSLTLRLWSLLSAGVAAIGAKAHAAAPSVGNFLSLCFGGVAARDVSGAIGRGLGAGLSGLSAKADVLMRQAGEALGPAMASIAARTHALAPAMASIAARTHALAPSLTERIGQARQAAGHYARGGALRVQSLLARSKEAPAAEGAYAAPVVAGAYAAPAAESENAVSLPPAVGRFDLSQMLIIAGALLLICGGLMLGGGLMLRAKTPAPLVAASASEPIAWLFEHPSLPLDERSVFVFDPTPDGLRIKGFAIGGVNLSEETLGALGGVIKPDGRDQDLDLALSVEKLEGDADGAQSESVAVLAEGAIPPQAPFRLVYLFPAEGANGGLTSQQVISTYGGVLLKVRYEMEGKQRSFIQYLPTSLLEEQLAEILASVKGS
jgi:hypothetical protein